MTIEEKPNSKQKEMRKKKIMKWRKKKKGKTANVE